MSSFIEGGARGYVYSMKVDILWLYVSTIAECEQISLLSTLKEKPQKP